MADTFGVAVSFWVAKSFEGWGVDVLDGGVILGNGAILGGEVDLVAKSFEELRA